MLVEAAKLGDIAPGGLKAAEANGKELVLGNYNGKIYAVERRCGHMNAPMELGTLDGYIMTCPLHYAQFDITTGECLSGPVTGIRPGEQKTPAHFIGTVMSNIRTHDLKTCPVQIKGDSIFVDV